VDEAAVTNVVLGQFEKVQRSKNKWKVVLKDCILTLDGRDYLLRRCTGEMEF
jgi:transcription initiation factor TFIIA large subunit